MSQDDHLSMDRSFEVIRESCIKDGPYEGIIGFSQGAGVAGLLCNWFKTASIPNQGPLKFVVFYSGFTSLLESHQVYYGTPITTPTLHILGTLDTVVAEERSLSLYEKCAEDSRQILRHPGGHFVPNSKPMVQAVVNFIQSSSAASAQTSSTEATPSGDSKESNDWDEFDKIGKA